jgi:glycosyltransferase involved in cell wall biosynthesis
MKKLLKKKTIIINATNIVEGGPLTILYDAINSVLRYFENDVEITVLVSNKNIIKNEKIKIIEFPAVRKSWFNRIIHELIVFNKLTKKIKPYFWLSLQDTSSIVTTHKQAVYCHCPISFHKFSIKDFYLEPTSFIRGILYYYIYRVNIHKNDHVIVQQEWMRNEFKKLFRHKSIIVARPLLENKTLIQKNDIEKKTNKKFIFIYPSLARFQKNYEVVCDAVEILNNENIKNFEVLFTFSKNENRYSNYIFHKSKNLEQIKLIGRQDKEHINELYFQADALLFTSKLETWGLPISEAKSFNLPMILSDLPFANEAVGSYKKVNFFKHNDPIDLSKKIKAALNHQWSSNLISDPKPLYAKDWRDLWNILLK